MNSRYPDATAEEIAREDVCIICREDMRPWQQSNASGAQQPDTVRAARAASTAVDERLRPKKLPCGHILHFACLRSWLERQQNCPTCRRPVLVIGTRARSQEQHPEDQQGRAQPHANQPPAQLPLQGNPQQPVAAQNVFNLGPLRIAFGARQIYGRPPQGNNDPHRPIQQGEMPLAGQIPRIGNAFRIQRQAAGVPTRTFANFSPANVQSQLFQIEQQLMQEINGLRLQQTQLHLIRALQGELARLRIIQGSPVTILNADTTILPTQSGNINTVPQSVHPSHSFSAISQQQTFSMGHPSLPAGLTLPPGWTVLPLQRLADERSADINGMGNANTSGSQSQPPNGSIATTSVGAHSSATAHSHHPILSNTAESPASENPPSKAGKILESSKAGIGASSSASGFGGRPAFTSDSPIPGMNGQSEFKSHTRQANEPENLSSDVLLSELPQWGSDANISQVNSSQGSNGQEGVGYNGSGSESTSNSAQIKGKGKASTVEDSNEDLD